MSITVRAKSACGRKTRQGADPSTDYIMFVDRVPTTEYSHLDGNTYSRPYGSPISRAFYVCARGYLSPKQILELTEKKMR